MGAPGCDAALVEELEDKEFRDAFVAEHVRTGVAYQIVALREQVGWSQAELGRRAGKLQNVISRLEDPEYGRPTIQTLLQLASAFDVALLVRFVPFSELVERTQDVSGPALQVPNFSKDVRLTTYTVAKREEAKMNYIVRADLYLEPASDRVTSANRRRAQPFLMLPEHHSDGLLLDLSRTARPQSPMAQLEYVSA